ncbi:hypothetical protein MRX96_030809 [Rhipicephalus microplus]
MPSEHIERAAKLCGYEVGALQQKRRQLRGIAGLPRAGCTRVIFYDFVPACSSGEVNGVRPFWPAALRACSRVPAAEEHIVLIGPVIMHRAPKLRRPPRGL